MLLEAYFIQMDNTWDRMQNLNETVHEAEAFIAFQLDNHRNQIIQVP